MQSPIFFFVVAYILVTALEMKIYTLFTMHHCLLRSFPPFRHGTHPLCDTVVFNIAFLFTNINKIPIGKMFYVSFTFNCGLCCKGPVKSVMLQDSGSCLCA